MIDNVPGVTRPPAVELYTMPETAEQLRVSRRWLQDYIKEHPFYRMAGRKKLFSADDIRKLHETMPRPEQPMYSIRQSGRAVSYNPSLRRTRHATVDEVLALLEEDKRKEREAKRAKREAEMAARRRSKAVTGAKQ